MADNGDGFFKGFIFGGIVGGILALLYAPKSGRETREELGQESEKILSRLKDDLENARKAAMQTFDESKDKILENMSQQKKTEEEEKKEEKPKRTRQQRPRPARRTRSGSSDK
jgi:gas vesicle protein